MYASCLAHEISMKSQRDLSAISQNAARVERQGEDEVPNVTRHKRNPTQELGRHWLCPAALTTGTPLKITHMTELRAWREIRLSVSNMHAHVHVTTSHGGIGGLSTIIWAWLLSQLTDWAWLTHELACVALPPSVCERVTFKAEMAG